MEKLLKELSLASTLLSDFKEMYEYENRLKTFTKWPFTENCKCTPENMAKAGFVHCPDKNKPDVAKCFFCLMELEGWEPNDNPWEEHTKHHNCGFLSLTKHFEDLTMEEFYMLEMTRLRTFLCKIGRSVINSFEEEVSATRQRLMDTFVSKHQYTPPPTMPLYATSPAHHSKSSYCQPEENRDKCEA